jgi:hypothetical protein
MIFFKEVPKLCASDFSLYEQKQFLFQQEIETNASSHLK